MNIKHLEHLLALADTGSFSRAAEKLFMTQSALSRSIQSLEDDLGGKVLDRIGKRNELTPLGLDVVARARHIVRDTAELRHSAQLLQEGGKSSISVGLGSGPGALLTIPLMCAAAQRYPAMRVAITRGPTELQVQQLRSRQLDAMVVDMRRVAPAIDLNIESLSEIRTGFVVNASHPLATKQTVTFEDIAKYPVASIPLSDEVVRLLVAQYGALANPSAMVTLACEDVAGLLATVAQSHAIYLGVLAAAKAGLQMGSLVELPIKPKLKVDARFAYVTLAGRTEAPVMGWFRQFVQEHLVD